MSRRDMAPPGAQHSNHDPLLIARYAARDVDAAEARIAERMVGECTDCAALVADLVTITRTVAAVPTPRRPRDFRISPEQAAAVRGSFLERILRRFAMPSTAVLQPLAGAAVAIGLVLVVVGGTLPGTSPAPMAPAPAQYSAGSEPSAGPANEGDAAASPAASAGAPIASVAPQTAASGSLDRPGSGPEVAPLASATAPIGVAEGAPDSTDDAQTGGEPAAASTGPPGPTSAPTDRVAARPSPDAAAGEPDEDASSGDAGQAAVQPDPAGSPLILAGALLAAMGALLLLLRVLARRWVRDPGLR